MSDSEIRTDRITDSAKQHSAGSFIKKALIWGMLFAIALGSIIVTRNYMYDHINGSDERKDEIAFEEMYFPELDRIYETGNLKELQREVGRLSLEEGSSAMTRWHHIKYLHYYTQWTMVEYTRSALAHGQDDVSNLSTGIWAALSILFSDDDFENNENYTDTEKETIRKYVDEASLLLTHDLSLTEEQYSSIRDSALYENGEINYDKVKEYVTAYYENGYRKDK